MAFSCKVILDSLAPCGSRLTTFEVTYPRCIHSEILTHRMFSRSSASSRAIPIQKMIDRVLEDPFIPIRWGRNGTGMQDHGELSPEEAAKAEYLWLRARDEAVRKATSLLEVGVHKQTVNRLLEPFMWITVIISATDYQNFFDLRCHADAEPHMQKIAYMMQDAYKQSVPQCLKAGQWHCPYIREDEAVQTDNGWNVTSLDPSIAASLWGTDIRFISVARCARVSYLSHDGKRDPEKDKELYWKLHDHRPKHSSPAEHVAEALDEPLRCGNFVGWRQLRQYWEQEDA